MADAIACVNGHNDEVAGRTGRLLAFFTRADLGKLYSAPFYTLHKVR